MPSEWKKGLTCLIFKKGGKMQCSNYKGITHLNVIYKIFTNIILKRLNVYIEEIIGDYQCGFRLNSSNPEQIFVMRQTTEKCYEYNTNLHILFIVIRQAFHRIYINQLFTALEHDGIIRKDNKTNKNDFTG